MDGNPTDEDPMDSPPPADSNPSLCLVQAYLSGEQEVEPDGGEGEEEVGMTIQQLLVRPL